MRQKKSTVTISSSATLATAGKTWRKKLIVLTVVGIAQLFCSVPLAEFSYADSKVTVGISLALTGPLAEYGEAVRNGFILAQKQLPELFTEVDFVFQDDAYDPKKAILNFRKFVAVDKVNLVFGWGVEPSLSLAPLAERQKLPFVTQSPLVSISKGRNYVVRFIYNDDKHGEVLVEYLSRRGVKKIGMIIANLSAFEIWSKGIEKHLKDDQSYEIVASVLPTESDFKSIIIGRDLSRYDILGLYLLPSQLRLFYKQAHELGIKLKTFGSTTFESTSQLRDVMPLIEGVPYTHSATNEDFIEDYQKEFGNDMHVGYAAGCYDFAIMLGRLVNGGKITTSSGADEVISALKSVEPFEGASGKIRFVDSPEYGKYFDSDLSVKKFVSGKIVTEFTMP